MKEKLKVGVVLNSDILPAWEFRIIEEIMHSDFATITMVVRIGRDILSAKKTKKSLGSVFQSLHEKTDRLIFKKGLDYSTPKIVSGLLKDTDELKINPIYDNSTSSIGDEDLLKIKSYNLDIILNFGSGNLKGNIALAAEYGILTYRTGDDRINGNTAIGYWEVVRKLPVTITSLEILNKSSDKGTIIYDSVESTYGFSVGVNRNKLFWRASLFVPRILEGIYRYEYDYVNRLVEKQLKKKREHDTSLSKVPKALPALFNFLTYFLVLARQICKKIFYSDDFNWILLFKTGNNKDILINNFSSYTRLQSSKDKFWADPFVVSHDGKYFIFVEELIYKTKKGHISVIGLDCDGKFLNTERIIEKPYHMSYPFIFELGNTFYMIPETSQNKTIDLYKCTGFPNKWEFVKSIMTNISAFDTTLFEYKGKWWLFTSLDKTNNISGSDTELFLFYSDDIFSGKWESHPYNPIVSDVTIARPAGRIFVHDNKIIRPSQDCSGRYGKAFNFNQILTLNENEYEETILTKIEPLWDSKLKGTHTFNSDTNISIIDAYSYRKRF